jgi:hypothetical protein
VIIDAHAEVRPDSDSIVARILVRNLILILNIASQLVLGLQYLIQVRLIPIISAYVRELLSHH